MTILDKSNLDNLRHKFETQLNSMVSLRLFTQDNLELIIPEKKCGPLLVNKKLRSLGYKTAYNAKQPCPLLRIK